MQERRNFSALAVELRLSCINPSMWTNADLLSIGPSGANFCEIFTEIYNFFKKMQSKCHLQNGIHLFLGLNVLNYIHFPCCTFIKWLHFTWNCTVRCLRKGAILYIDKFWQRWNQVRCSIEKHSISGSKLLHMSFISMAKYMYLRCKSIANALELHLCRTHQFISYNQSQSQTLWPKSSCYKKTSSTLSLSCSIKKIT